MDPTGKNMDEVQMNIPDFQDIKELESVFKANREAIFLHDYETGKIVDVNEDMLEMYGYTYNEALNIGIDQISAGKAPHTVEESNELFNKAKQYGYISFEWYDRKKNGKFFWTDNIMKVVRIQGVKRIIVLSRDITERKKKQLELQSIVRERTEEISELNEKLTLANEELKIGNEELETYKIQLEELVSIRTRELKRSEERLIRTENRYSNFVEQSAEGISYFEPAKPFSMNLPVGEQVDYLLQLCSLVECNNSFARMYGCETRSQLFGKSMTEIFGKKAEKEKKGLLTEFIRNNYRLTDFQTTETFEDGALRHYIHNLSGMIRGNKLIGIWNAQRNITDLVKAEESLKYKGALEQLIAGLSTRFFNLTPEIVDRSIVDSLKEMCNFIGTDAGFLVEIIYSEGIYRLSHVWNNEKIAYDQHYFNRAPLNELHEWLGNIQNVDYYLVTSSDDLPDKTFVKSSFQQSGTASMVVVPIRYQGNLVGFIGSSTIDPARSWEQDEISLFRVIGEAFVNAITRMNSEKVLIESERNYREIFNATNEAIFIHDANTGEILDVNHSAIQLFGFTHEEALSSNANFFSSTEEGFNHSSAVNYIKQALNNETVVFEWLAKRKEGENFWAEVSLKCSEIGGDMRVLAVVRDISERKKSEELIRQSEERFRSIIQYLTDIIWIIDSANTIIFESPSSWHVLGYEPGYLLGKPGLKLIHPEDLSMVMADLKEVFTRQNDYLPTEFRAKHKDGHWVSLEAIANNMLDHPAIRGIIITCRDISERKIVEKALKLSESRFRNIFNNSSDAIVITSNNFSFLEVNEVFLKITGYTLQEIPKMKFSDIVTDSYLPQIADQFMRFFQHENLPALECEIKCIQQTNMPAEINSKLIEFEGQPALVSIIRDITERKQIENRILDTILSTEEREREKFARNLHDELGPLLSSIKMYVNSLASSVDPQKNEFVMVQLQKILSEAIQSTKELSNDLSPHVLSSYGLVAALEWFIDQLKPYIYIVLETNLKEERFPNMLELSIYRIIKELINNTLKHAQASAITIKLHAVLKSVQLNYSDNGKGFPENWHDHYQYMGMGMSNIMSRCRSIKAISRFYNHTPYGMSFEMDVPVE